MKPLPRFYLKCKNSLFFGKLNENILSLFFPFCTLWILCFVKKRSYFRYNYMQKTFFDQLQCSLSLFKCLIINIAFPREMDEVSFVFKNERYWIELKNLASISNTRKKSIVSADLKSGMKGRWQKVLLNSLTEVNKKPQKIQKTKQNKTNYSALNFFLSSHIWSYTLMLSFLKNLLSKFSVFLFPCSPNLLKVLKVLYHFSDTSDATPFLMSVLSNTNYFFLSKGQQARYFHLTVSCLIYVHIFFYWFFILLCELGFAQLLSEYSCSSTIKADS